MGVEMGGEKMGPGLAIGIEEHQQLGLPQVHGQVAGLGRRQPPWAHRCDPQVEVQRRPLLPGRQLHGAGMDHLHRRSG